jgi:hypothetical protein
LLYRPACQTAYIRNPRPVGPQSAASDRHRHSPREHNLNYTIWTLYAEPVSFLSFTIFPLWARAQKSGHAQKNQSSNFACAQKNQSGNSARTHIPAKIQCAQDLEGSEQKNRPAWKRQQGRMHLSKACFSSETPLTVSAMFSLKKLQRSTCPSPRLCIGTVIVLAVPLTSTLTWYCHCPFSRNNKSLARALFYKYHIS